MHFLPYHFLNSLLLLHFLLGFKSLSLSLSLFSPPPLLQMGRPPCCDKSNVKRGLWTAEEDAKILAYVSNHGVGNWTLVPKKAGLNRCGKSCRLRWTNYLRPDLRHDSFSVEEEDLIINLHQAIGSRWSLIAKRLPGRTDNDVKNYWNTKLRKKLITIGIDPITHKPFSQIFYDYGNINGLPNPENQNSSFIRNSKPEPSPLNLISSQPVNLHFQKNNQESIQQQFLDEVTSSCSSSSACNVTQLNSPDHSSFSWSHFLLHDTFLQKQSDDGLNAMKQTSKSKPMAETEHSFKEQGEESCLNSRPSSPKPCQDSFVNTILDRDSEIRAVFPEILDEYFDY